MLVHLYETMFTECSIEELSCEATPIGGEVTNKCYNTTNEICKAGGFNALCDKYEDVEHCRKFKHMDFYLISGTTIFVKFRMSAC